MELYLLDTAPLENESLFLKYYESCPPYYKKKVADRKKIDDKCLRLGCGILIAKGLEKYGIIAENAEILTSEYGKPYLSGKGPCFNLSHSGKYVAAVFCDYDVGIDIEMYREINLKAVKKYYKPLEYKLLSDCSDEVQREQKFIKLWTRKESLIKASGTALGKFLRSDEMPLLADVEKEVVFMGGKYRIFEYDLDGYSLAVCALNCTVKPKIEEVLL